VGIITDGNGRWAHRQGLALAAGHDAAADTLKARIADALDFGIQQLSAYTFSTENWSRPAAEVDALMEMFTRRLAIEAPELERDGVKMRFIGRREGLPPELLEQMDLAQSAEGRLEGGGEPGPSSSIAGPLALQSDEEEFRRCLYAPDMHDPELIIRTSGEQRLSNYLLWQAAYSELVFRDELWPDFTRESFEESLAELQARERRFGAR
jgi:undecaprenyl diphosphate synthase